MTQRDEGAAGDAVQDAVEPGAEASPYMFDPEHVPVAARLLDLGFERAGRWAVGEAIRTELASEGLAIDDPLALEIVRATYHRVRVNTDPIGTALVSWNGPEELVTQEVLKLWVAVEPALTNDAARAAVADFLWERRVGRRAWTVARFDGRDGACLGCGSEYQERARSRVG
jgi:hypothetical protein